MRYYLIAGEASGDLHASHLMAALRSEDSEADFRFFGGDKMQAIGGTLVRHYRDLAYMGFIPVLLHARTILRGLEQCKRDIAEWKPDVVILIDYPGFNLKIAKYVHQNRICPVYYYIAPKLWAWKEWRIKNIKRDVDELFSILPFEVDFFEKKHNYPIHYVGNPTVDEVADYLSPDAALPTMTTLPPTAALPPTGGAGEGHGEGPGGGAFISLLPGSRKHEIKDNLRIMLKAVEPYADRYSIVIAKAPNIEEKLYSSVIASAGLSEEAVTLTSDTYTLLSRSTAALVVSGTAVLETALFRVPQVTCYHAKGGILAHIFQHLFIKIPFVTLVNLVAGREVVPELLGIHMTPQNCRAHLATILPGGCAREAQLSGYEEVAERLGQPGAPQRAAKLIIEKLNGR